MTRPDRIAFELVAELFHVDAQIMAVLDMRGTPDVAQELAVRDHHTEVLGETGQQTKLDGRQMNLRARSPHLSSLKVHGDFPELYRFLAGWRT